MYFSDPAGPATLAATGVAAAQGFVTAAVLIFVGMSLITIGRQARRNAVRANTDQRKDR